MLPSIFFSLNVENVRECCKAQWVCIDQNIAPCKSDLLLLGGFQSSGSGWFRLPQGWKPLGIDVQLASRSTCSHLLSSFHHWHWWSDEQKASALVFFFRFEAAECCSWVVPYVSGFVDGKSDCNFPSTVVFTVVVIRIIELVAFCFVCSFALQHKWLFYVITGSFQRACVLHGNRRCNYPAVLWCVQRWKRLHTQDFHRLAHSWSIHRKLV